MYSTTPGIPGRCSIPQGQVAGVYPALACIILGIKLRIYFYLVEWSKLCRYIYLVVGKNGQLEWQNNN